ncbi:homocitrate synthase [Mycobacterium gordonae]|uniref:homocitrate synthase n=1 Tax=Mycobacterium gordonae TaxID=1778 RepID=UPI00210C8328|nr:homocitrate synthase [Mycobacterium gordonae]MBX9983289.1 homocitrate synthase [Mycobacterium gordonae]MCQ4361275.1 homocitrate synthase [Mycobacterium gordonae]
MTILSQDLHHPAAIDSAEEWFRHHFGLALPAGLREQAGALSWQRFVAVFSPLAGPVRLGQWSCDDAHRPASRMGPQARTFRAVIAVGDRIGTSTAAGGGEVAALTAMLHGRGIRLEILKFHQMCSGNDVATLVRGTDGTHPAWAMGWAEDRTESALRAVIGCVNRLLASGCPA